MDNSNNEVREFLLKYINGKEIKDNDDIFSLGYVNSLFAMELVMFLEKTYSISIESQDLELDNFRSINAITSLIAQKLVIKKG